MAETNREETGRSRERALATNHLSLEINKIPRDLLRGFMSISADSAVRYSRSKTFCEDDCKDGDDEIELSLGLSLGGRFGIDKTPGKLKRSSSIAGTMPIFREQVESESSAAAMAAAGKPLNCNFTPGLTRTTSLPTEMEEEWSKRKEIQTLRRMEARRRRFIKQRSSRISSCGNSDTHTASFGLESWVTAAATVGSDDDGCGRGGEGSSLSLSELDSKNQQGSSNIYGEETSPKYITRCSSHREAENPGILVATEKPGMRRCNSIDGRGKERGAAMVNMPCVFTKGEGPNGRRIEGILYKYGKGEEVRIICVCHGSFLSPAEFVRHAGGGDVDHPLRHIVVNTSSSAASLFL